MTELEALQTALAAEHAACYGYAVLGGVLGGLAPGGLDDARASDAYDAHRDLRDHLGDLIDTLGVEPVAALPAYGTPFPIRSIAACRRFARVLENRCASVYAYAVTQTSLDSRKLMADVLGGCAVRGFGWGTGPTAFPGMDAS